MASYGQSVTIGYYAYNTSTPGYQTGDATNHTLKLIKDGTAASPTNSPSEVDSTNCPGLYTLTLTTAETQHNLVILGGKSSTSDVIIIGTQISFEQLPTALDANGYVKADVEDWKGSAAVAIPANFASFSIDTSGRIDVGKILGTASAGVAGYAGIDWSAINAPATAVGLSATTVSDLSTGTAAADALLNRDISVGTDSGSSSVRTVRQALRFLRNKWAIVSGTLTVYKEDDATSSWTATVTTDASADPITANDPT